MRSEQEVNRAVECYSDMILRLCMVYLKHPQDAEDIFQTVFLKYTLSDKLFEIATRAVSDDRANRQQTIRQFTAEWEAAQ